jgi:hypothetical protein
VCTAVSSNARRSQARMGGIRDRRIYRQMYGAGLRQKGYRVEVRSEVWGRVRGWPPGV